MFTGLIEDLGKVIELNISNNSATLSISSPISDYLSIGDSIAINGVCLTVVNSNNNYFYVDIMAETLSKTNLYQLTKNQKVNLERAMKLSDRIAGHIVTGHIDELGTLVKKTISSISIELEISASKSILVLIAEKGSVAIDGVSLTIVKVKENSFIVHLIPHTAKNTTLGFKNVGDIVNLESDILAKYLHNFFKNHKLLRDNQININDKFLKDTGFL